MLQEGKERVGPVVYWMSRDQRIQDNWALLFAQELALQKKEPLIVVFILVEQFLEANLRHYGFMLKGLQEVQDDLYQRNIPFLLLKGSPKKEMPRFIITHEASACVTDFDPLRMKRVWEKEVAEQIDVPFYEVDTHNVVPCRIASPKAEYAAYTFRPKIYRALPEFLEKIPQVKTHPFEWDTTFERERDFIQIMDSLPIDKTIAQVNWLSPGAKKARQMLNDFLQNKIETYVDRRNDPTQDGQSHLSPYLHFGQIAAQRVALEIQKSSASAKTKEAFLEELIVRRELSDNFCFYNPQYDAMESFPSWARSSLIEHGKDLRKYIYSAEDFEQGKTHDALWNAAQMQMVKSGKMHGYMRMYWAKKILEWSATAREAFQIALYLNNKYELDGRDSSGYAGIAWSIGGVHDRAWPQRPIFGKIRYMSYQGCKAKFNVNAYIQQVERL
ncbi:MAG: deoxyribodipyrimidine photo-lyase [Deltaproteobacteria bacterium]|nr:deoxyribodipyrimidine photo-lyase [Deltaproteobacteria bacterium]